MTQGFRTKADPIEQQIERTLKRGILTRLGRCNGCQRRTR